ncbi:MAG: MmgE/PrpD family protein, partial [Deltaproteobacteria bacterium]|nr:MmgE/PrpD family protein [Deltaproteobacteria bacterium]
MSFGLPRLRVLWIQYALVPENKPVVKSQEGVCESTVWNTSFQGPAANAALANGALIHSFDFDDYHMTKIHPAAAVMPAALAIGEKERIDGKRFLCAVTAGYETMIH